MKVKSLVCKYVGHKPPHRDKGTQVPIDGGSADKAWRPVHGRERCVRCGEPIV